MKSLSDLVAQAESIATNLEDDEIPHIQRSIDQLRQRGGQYSFNRGAQNDMKAAKLLGPNVGYELPAGLSKTIESLQIVPALDTESQMSIVDIPGFLKKERETAILTSINMTRNKTVNDSYKKCEMAKNEWWREEKNKILSLLSSGDKLPYLINSCSQRGFDRQSNEAQMSGKLGRDETSYARQVSQFLDGILLESSGTTKPLSSYILEEESSPMKSSKCGEMSEIARLISRYCSLSSVHDISEQRESEGQMSKQMVSIALNHLETELYNYVRQYVDTIAGISSTDQRMMLVTFLKSRMLQQIRSNDGSSFEDGVIYGVPVWPLIYLCLRSGLIDEAVEVAHEAIANLSDWYLWLKEFVTQGRVSNEAARKIATEYKRTVRNTNDGCKRLVYSLVGGCDIEDNHQQVLLSVDDFMWVRLSHLRRSYSSPEHQSQLNRSQHRLSLGTDQQQPTLAQLQRLISEEYGESHFQADQQPATYCKLLLLCQLFEPGLAFLARSESLRCHSVHCAITLWHHGLLLVSDTVSAPLLGTDPHNHHVSTLPRLNLARLTALYTRSFELAHPREALDLFYLLSELPSNGPDAAESVFVSLASTLALDDGVRENILIGRGGSASLLSRFGDAAGATVLATVTNRLIESGRREAASDVLTIARQQPEAASVLSDLLAASIGSPGNGDSERLLAKSEHLYRSMPSSPQRDTLGKLIDIAEFMTLCVRGDIDAALVALDRVNIVPAAAVQSSVVAFRGLPEVVRALVPSILIATMRLLRMAANQRRQSGDAMADLRRRATTLITFTGQLHYRMPADVYAGLSQLEIDIN